MIYIDATCLWSALAFEGSHALVTHGNGCGYNWKGYYASSMQEAFTRGYGLRPYDLPCTVKMTTMFGEYIRKNYQNKFYAKAQNLVPVIKNAYDSVLNNKALHVGGNTAHFNVTGHPALTVNAGFSEGCPVGLMIVGKMFDDATVLQIGKAFEERRQSSVLGQKQDNIAVAGVPMMNGSKIWEGYTPEFDATIVTRILDADMCLSGASCTTSYGPLRNPYDETRATGGSSCGSALLVARGDVDMAIGGDQGGSIRIPSSWCGLVGLKPTWGLVPYTGAISMEMTIDHVGPMTKTVEDCAIMLELDSSLAGKKIAVLKEGFYDCDPCIAECVRNAVSKLKQAGATVDEVSIPLHHDGSGYHWKGRYLETMQEAFARGYNNRPFDTSYPVKMSTIFGEYIKRNYQNKFYSKAQNLSRVLKDQYDKVLRNYDVMIMPTLKQQAPKLPTMNSTVKERFEVTVGLNGNTSSFNITGHPAITIKAGNLNGLPVGMMIVGRMFDEVSVLQVARSFEQL
ncbi:hypothetical protein KUTeg_021058 [Tegillarca granosa]|uniref:Amidase domain-containing protein n=1 Tax=Tegillarca granosa TaxID=220873 RepID=A0ABQ9ECC7_TEGGR|nr:hypothetical protein KUTeg_021058 [Tegillarca granosa]